MKILIKLFTALVAICSQQEVFAFFLGPATDVAYTEAYPIGVGQTAADLTDATKGKQILISRGTKAQILAWDANGNPARWIAPDKTWLAAVLNGSATDFTKNIDLNASDLVFGTGETVALTYDATKKIPFKKVGKTVVYDGTLAANVSTNASGFTTNPPGTTTTTTPGTTPTVEPNKPTLSNAATGLAALPIWAWFLIVPVAIVLIVVIVKAIVKAVKKGGKKTTSK